MANNHRTSPACRASRRRCGSSSRGVRWSFFARSRDRKSTRLNSSHRCISYAVFCLKKVNGVAGVVDKQLLARPMLLAQNDFLSPKPFFLEIAEPAVALPLPIFLPVLL